MTRDGASNFQRAYGSGDRWNAPCVDLSFVSLLRETNPGGGGRKGPEHRARSLGNKDFSQKVTGWGEDLKKFKLREGAGLEGRIDTNRIINLHM